MTKTMQLHMKYWANGLNEAMQTYNITQKKTKGLTPYELVFEKKVMLPIELDITECQKERLFQLNKLDDLRQEAPFHLEVVQ